ncbi:MAG: methyltransferase domain-containing protein [Nitrospiraceae bacterium]|nr:methyltransferase domain-containing protein [Nitrospiraceae bacterium]
MLPARLESVKDKLECPACRGGLVFETGKASCRQCAREYDIRNGKIYFASVPSHTDSLDLLKERLRGALGKYYYSIGKKVFAPVFPFDFKKQLFGTAGMSEQTVVDLGSGNVRMGESVICVDLFDYDAVDIVCDIDALPFREGSVDVFVSRGVLEHVPRPERVAAEISVRTKPGGLGFHMVPFLFPFHASPHDYQRFTHKGIEALFEGFEILDLRNTAGPVSLMLLVLIEFFSIIFSFGNGRTKNLVYLLFCFLLFPVKYLDFPFVNRQAFLPLAPTIFAVMKKK